MEQEKLTEEVIGAAIRVQEVLEPGMLETVYRMCLAHELRSSGHAFKEGIGLEIRDVDLTVSNAYRLDLPVDGCLVPELKTVEKLLPVHQAQLATSASAA